MQTICRFVARFYDFLWDLPLFCIAKHTKIKLLVEFYSSNSRHGENQKSLALLI